MGLGSFTTQDDDESSGGNKSTYVTFKNPSVADVSEGSEHRHQQEYYDAVKQMRNQLGQDINVPFGEFAVAAVEADKGDTEKLNELFSNLTEE